MPRVGSLQSECSPVDPGNRPACSRKGSRNVLSSFDAGIGKGVFQRRIQELARLECSSTVNGVTAC